jgi:hypothetical protein
MLRKPWRGSVHRHLSPVVGDRRSYQLDLSSARMLEVNLRSRNEKRIEIFTSNFYEHTPCDGLRVIKCLLDVIDGAKWHT